MGIEFELKFRAKPEILETLRQQIPGEETLFRMETTYYDTREGALSERKITLRRRMENEVSVCTLKTPVRNVGVDDYIRPRVDVVIHPNKAENHLRNAEGGVPYERNMVGRGEFEVLCDSIEKALPELCKLSGVAELAALTVSGVVPVCGARFTRVAKLVKLSDCTVELALDRGVLTGGGREIPLCEVEVELKSGSREGAVAYALALAGTYGLKQEHNSKFRRALALAKGE